MIRSRRPLRGARVREGSHSHMPLSDNSIILVMNELARRSTGGDFSICSDPASLSIPKLKTNTYWIFIVAEIATSSAPGHS